MIALVQIILPLATIIKLSFRTSKIYIIFMYLSFKSYKGSSIIILPNGRARQCAIIIIYKYHSSFIFYDEPFEYNQFPEGWVHQGG